MTKLYIPTARINNNMEIARIRVTILPHNTRLIFYHLIFLD